jgi:hypothetical protein
MPGLPDIFGNLFTALRADDPQDDMAEGDPLFKNDAHHVTCGKTQRIENPEDGLFRDPIDDGGYDDQPHADLDEPKQEGNLCPALYDADGPHGPHGDIHNPCRENGDSKKNGEGIEPLEHARAPSEKCVGHPYRPTKGRCQNLSLRDLVAFFGRFWALPGSEIPQLFQHA